MEFNLNIENKNKLINYEKKIFDELFLKKGFPNKKDEDWKFTDLDRIIKINFDKLTNFTEKKNFKTQFRLKFDHYSVYTLNGYLVDYFEDFPFNLNRCESSQISHKSISKTNKNSMQTLNSMLTDRGYSIKISKKMDKPIVIYNFFNKDLNDKMINSFNFINIENTETTIIEYNFDDSNTSHLKNTYQNIFIKNGTLNYYFINDRKTQSYNYSNNLSKLNNAELKYYILSSGIKFRKDDNEIYLNGSKSNCEIYSASYLKKDEHQEIKTVINHEDPNCKSRQKIKKILGDNSRGIFQGKIFVNERAQKTNAYQLSNALILNDAAEFNAKPELEIYADDVKCSHGSSSGNLDKDAIYYLMARGIEKGDAIQLLVKGFLSEIIETIKLNYLKEVVEEHIEKSTLYEN